MTEQTAQTVDPGFEDDTDPVWRLTVTLTGVDRPVWRQLEFLDCSLDELHILIQKAFGWSEGPRYAFRRQGTDYMDPKLAKAQGLAGETGDVAEAWLSDLVESPGDQLEYIYEPGDRWEHRITVDQVDQTEDPFVPPQCLDGAGACPPENVGGPAGYAAYLAALSDPHHKDHERMLAWNGPFDPEAFDLEATNAELRRGYDQWEAEVLGEVEQIERQMASGELDEEDDIEDEDALAGPSASTGLASPQYPLGTVCLYGPDLTTTTKIVAAVFANADADPVLERWVGSDIAKSSRVQEEIQAFFQRHGVKQSVTTDGNIGCPHEAGEDFPAGEDCPFCPAWRGKQ